MENLLITFIFRVNKTIKIIIYPQPPMHQYSNYHHIIRDKWSDFKHTKNHPKTCEKTHSFCNFDYEWAQQKQSQKVAGTLINPSIPNVTLPKRQQKSITVNYEDITQQDLDDWFAQSLNRNITSMLNPKKNFYLPQSFQDGIKYRYRNRPDVLKVEEDIYFTSNQNKRKKLNSKKGKQQLSQLLFNYKNLDVKNMPGLPIRVRQSKNNKPMIKRRNAVFLDQDLHYNRLLKDLSKSKDKNVKKESGLFLTQTETMFYSYNIQSLQRKSCFQKTPSSITEKQYNRLKQPPKDVLSNKNEIKAKQQAMHEKFRQNLIENTKISQKKIIQIGSSPFMHQQRNNSSPKIIKSMSQIQKPNNFRSVKRQNSNTTNSFVDTKSIGKDKILEKKIVSLLNDMQITSENINFQISELNIHLNEVSLKTVDTRPQTKWVLKAQQKLAEKQAQLAIDCYKQALIIQPEFFVPIFNIAALLQKEKLYYQAKRWFEICRQFQIDEQNVCFGLAIVNLKQMKFQECYTIVEELIKKYEVGKKQSKLVYYYIRALCLKKLRKFDQAKNDYGILIKNCQTSNYSFMSIFMFSVVFAKSRRLDTKFDCLSYLNFKQTSTIIYFTPEPRLGYDNQPLKNIAKKIINYPFFKRFSISLIEKLLEISTYETLKTGSLVFINQQQTAIILNGLVVVRNHLKEFDRPQTIFLLEKGGVIGGGQLDDFMNEKANNWFLAQSDVQIIKIQRKSFNQFWKGQITFEFDFKYNYLKNVPLFNDLPDATLFRICQRIQKVQHTYGTILFNDCSYRNKLVNKRGFGFGLGKKANSTDPRFINIKKFGSQRRKGRCRIAEILKKNYRAFEDMKFSKLKYPGLFILVKGKIQVQDDRGFRCEDLIGQRQYFGQNLLIDSDGFHNYGRMVVNSKSAELYYIPIQKLPWCFTSEDKFQMKKNAKKRQSIETISFLRNRFIECQNTRINYRYLLNNWRS